MKVVRGSTLNVQEILTFKHSEGKICMDLIDCKIKKIEYNIHELSISRGSQGGKNDF